MVGGQAGRGCRNAAVKAHFEHRCSLACTVLQLVIQSACLRQTMALLSVELARLLGDASCVISPACRIPPETLCPSPSLPAGPFFSWPAVFLSGEQAAAGFAFINSVGAGKARPCSAWHALVSASSCLMFPRHWAHAPSHIVSGVLPPCLLHVKALPGPAHV